jgi:DNA-binding MarR family transcriptional regulator
LLCPKQIFIKFVLTKTIYWFKFGGVRERDHIDELIAKWRQERPEYDLAPVEIIGRAGRIMEFVDRALESKFEEFGISRATFDVLATLRRNGPPYKMTQRDLMRSLLRTSGSMSLRIASLENQNLVTRQAVEDDRRSVFVILTSKGSKLLDAIIPGHLANEANLLAGLNNAERAELVSLLRKWLTTLEANAEQGPQLFLDMVVLHAHASLLKRRAVGLPDIPGLLVHSVEPGGRAYEAGIPKGDLIYAIDNSDVTSSVELRKALNKQKPHIKLFRLVRGSERIELQIPKS